MIEKMAKAKLAIYVGCGVMIASSVQVPVARPDSTDDRDIHLRTDEGQCIADRAPRDGLIKFGHLICDDMSHVRIPVRMQTACIPGIPEGPQPHPRRHSRGHILPVI